MSMNIIFKKGKPKIYEVDGAKREDTTSGVNTQTTDPYQATIDEIKAHKEAANNYMNAYANNSFNFDLNGNALYNQYKDQYTKQARMGMEDAIGRASALTGGYGNSYAQAVGQQAYYNQMDGLNDVAMRLYEMAYGQYQDQQAKNLQMAQYYSGLASGNEDLLEALKKFEQTGDDDWVYDESKVPAPVIEALKGAKTNTEINSLLNKYWNGGVIDENTSAALASIYGLPTEYFTKDKSGNDVASYSNMMKYINKWNAGENDGGFNWFGGIDGNAEVVTPLGETLTGDQLYAKLLAENMSKEEAKKLIIDLQKQFNINK